MYIYMLLACKLISTALPPCQRQETFLLPLAKELFFQLFVFLAVAVALGWWFALGVVCAQGTQCVHTGGPAVSFLLATATAQPL